MSKKLMTLGILAALFASLGFLAQPAKAAGCSCSPCQCEAPCPCQ